MSLKNTMIIGFFAIFFASCSDDDNGANVESVPPRLLSEVAAENDIEIQEYLNTHFYNYEEFANPPEGFDFKIVFDTIAGDNAGKTPLIDQVESAIINISSSDFLIDGDEVDIPHTYYYLSARPGVGDLPTFADSTFVKFEGSLLDGEVFDGVSTVAAFDVVGFQLPGFGFQRAFRGVGEGIQQFRSGTDITVNDDGTFNVSDSGIGFVIFPSGLANFNGVRGSIAPFSPLIFTLEILSTKNADHDNDGVLSISEDINGDGLLFNDNTDGADVVDYIDFDDDNDGIPTREEITIAADGTVTFPDSDNDDTPDYLDSDS